MKDTTKAVLFVIGLLAVMGVAAFVLLKPAASIQAGTQGPSQEVSMSVVGYKYQPSTLTIKAGQPVRWIVDASQAAGCAHSLVVPRYGINKVLQNGQNIIEFTPTEKGTVPFSCSMGMVRGQFNVI